MSLYRQPRSKKWWCRFTAPDGTEVRRSSGTEDRRQAQEYEDRLRAELWRVHHLGEKPRRTWQEAVVRWVDEHQHKATLDDDLHRLRWLDGHLGHLHLDEIDRDTCEAFACAKAQEGVSPTTVNHLLQIVRAILRTAQLEWSWLAAVPKIRFRPVPKRRVRWLTHEEADKLLAALPEHLEAAARFALATGLREANVTGLEWSQVDLGRRVAWVHPDQAKARKAIPVPLGDEAILVLRRQIGKRPIRVFTFRGRPFAKAGGKAWRRALEAAGIENFRWHDLRHTWASWHVQAGTPLHVLQELGGWNDIRMVQKYAHLGAEHLAEYAGNVDRGLQIVRTLSGTPGNGDEKSRSGKA